jgi:putative transcriptional regulator
MNNYGRWSKNNSSVPFLLPFCKLPVFLFIILSLGLPPEISATLNTGPLMATEAPVVKPKQGMLLVGKRGIKDPRFQQAVILLAVHGPQGTLGLIINKPTNIPLSRAVPYLEGIDKIGHSLFFGGPVAPNQISFLAHSKEPLPDAKHIIGEVYFSFHLNALEQALQSEHSYHGLKVYQGHAGWAPSQLQTEISRGDWYLVPMESKFLFYQDAREIWSDLIKRFVE